MSKDAIRAALAASEWCMGTADERRRLIGSGAMKRDATKWYAFARSGWLRDMSAGGEGVPSISAEECMAWAILYRAAFYGRLPLISGRAA